MADDDQDDAQRILLTQAEDGMELARPVLSSKRVILCGRGTVLSDDLIHKLMLLGIKRVFVKGHPLPAQEERSLDEELALLQRRFARVEHRPLMRQLRDVVGKQLREWRS